MNIISGQSILAYLFNINIKTMQYLRNLEELMVAQLRSIYSGEKYILTLLDELKDHTTDLTLKGLLKTYADQTADQVIVLKRIFNDLFEQKRGGNSEAMEFMTNEARSEVASALGAEIKDALIVLSIQHIIHYKITKLGAICTYGKLMEYYDEGATLHKELELEKKMDRKLAMVAESIVDVKVPKNNLVNKAYESF